MDRLEFWSDFRAGRDELACQQRSYAGAVSQANRMKYGETLRSVCYTPTACFLCQQPGDILIRHGEHKSDDEGDTKGI